MSTRTFSRGDAPQATYTRDACREEVPSATTHRPDGATCEEEVRKCNPAY